LPLKYIGCQMFLVFATKIYWLLNILTFVTDLATKRYFN